MFAQQVGEGCIGIAVFARAAPAEPAGAGSDVRHLLAQDDPQDVRRGVVTNPRKRVIMPGVTSSPRASSTLGTSAMRARHESAVLTAISQSPLWASKSP